MLTENELFTITFCLEGFFFGKISVRCALTFTLAKKKVQLSLGLGIYSGIFALYLQCHLKDSRTTFIVFYVLCLLYVLSMAVVISDSLENILNVSNNSICKIIIIMMQMPICAIASDTKRFTVNFFSQSYCPNRSLRFCWLPRAVYLGTHKYQYLSSIIHQIFKDLPLLDRVG